MKISVVTMLVGGLVLGLTLGVPLRAQSPPAATAPPRSGAKGAAGPISAAEALSSYAWKWNDQEVSFLEDHNVKRSWRPFDPWNWKVTGPRTFTIEAMAREHPIVTFTFDEPFTRFDGRGFDGKPIAGLRLAPVRPVGTIPPTTAVAPNGAGAKSAAGYPSAGAASTPSPDLPSPDARSQLANFWKQLPSTAAWAHSALDVPVPAEFGEKLNMFKRGLTAESGRNGRDLQKAYVRAIGLTDLLGGTYAQRRQAGSGQTASPAVMAQWTVLATTRRILFRNSRSILDEAIFTGGGLAKTVPVINEAFPLAVLPVAPAGAMSHDFEAVPAWVKCGGRGPSGTNFGWGDRKLKLGVGIESNSDVPIAVKVESYWVGWDGKRHQTVLADRRKDAVSLTHPVQFEVGNTVQRNNGATFGVVDSAAFGVYRGWLVVVSDPQGNRITTWTNTPLFQGLVK